MPETKIIKVFGRNVTPSQGQELLQAHHAAFSQSACRACPGICCKDCAESDGYLYKDNLSTEEIDNLKDEFGFDAKTGFKGDAGCKLPLRNRSTICASFYCETLGWANTFARNILAQRREKLGVIKGLDVFEVDAKVEELHQKMRAVFD